MQHHVCMLVCVLQLVSETEATSYLILMTDLRNKALLTFIKWVNGSSMPRI